MIVMLRPYFLWCIDYCLYSGNISAKFSINSESYTSEFIENLEDLSPWYYIYSDVCSRQYYTVAKETVLTASCMLYHFMAPHTIVDPSVTDNTLLDGWRFEHAKHTTMGKQRFSSHSEAIASEWLENLEEMFPHY